MSRQSSNGVGWTRQLGLAVALFTLGAFAFWVEYKHKPAKESSEEQSKKVFQMKDTPIQSIRLFDGSKSFVLTCSDLAAKLCKPGDQSKWELSEPIKLKADDSNTNALVSTLNTLTSTETIDLKEETSEKKSMLLKDYGLDPDSRKNSKKVQVTTSAGETTLYLGSNHPIGESIFALAETGGKPNENLVYLIPSYFKSNLEKDLTFWRDKKLLTLGVHEVASFQLAHSKANLSGERKEGQWVLRSKNDEFPGDSESVDQLLSAAVFINAKNFAAENKSDPKAKTLLKGLASALTLTLQKEKGAAKELPAPIVLNIYRAKGKPPTKTYATVSNLDPVFELEGSAPDRLEKTLKDLRLSKLITSMDRFGAKKLEFSGNPLGSTSLVLVNTDGKWTNAADKSPVSSEKLSDLLEKLSGNRIKEFLPLSATPTGENEGITVAIGDDKGEPKRKLVFWKRDGKLYARDLLSKRNESFLVDSAVQDALPWNKDFFKPVEKAPESKPTPK